MTSEFLLAWDPALCVQEEDLPHEAILFYVTLGQDNATAIHGRQMSEDVVRHS